MRNPIAIKDLLSHFLAEQTPQRASPQMLILEHWPRIVSQEAVEYTAPAVIRNYQLLIIVSNSAWLHRLTMRRQELLNSIESIVGQGIVKEIRLKIGNPQERRNNPT